MHTNRARAESFGRLAADYDRARPSYPDALLDDLLTRPDGEVPTVLDIGCGTGKVAVPLIARGAAVLGVEVDERMAEVARAHGVPVEVAGFETWDDAGRRCDLIVCGQAWHWIDAAVGAPKAARLLRPGGVLALFWNFATFDRSTQDALDAAYAARAPHLSGQSVICGRGPGSLPDHLPALWAAGFSVEQRRYSWTRTYTAEQWLDLLRTHSDHSTLPDAVRVALLGAIADAIAGLGGTVTAQYGTETLLARL